MCVLLVFWGLIVVGLGVCFALWGVDCGYLSLWLLYSCVCGVSGVGFLYLDVGWFDVGVGLCE